MRKRSNKEPRNPSRSQVIRLYPNKRQKRLMGFFSSCSKYVYNWALDNMEVMYASQEFFGSGFHPFFLWGIVPHGFDGIMIGPIRKGIVSWGDIPIFKRKEEAEEKKRLKAAKKKAEKKGKVGSAESVKYKKTYPPAIQKLIECKSLFISPTDSVLWDKIFRVFKKLQVVDTCKYHSCLKGMICPKKAWLMCDGCTHSLNRRNTGMILGISGAAASFTSCVTGVVLWHGMAAQIEVKNKVRKIPDSTHTASIEYAAFAYKHFFAGYDSMCDKSEESKKAAAENPEGDKGKKAHGIKGFPKKKTRKSQDAFYVHNRTFTFLPDRWVEIRGIRKLDIGKVKMAQDKRFHNLPEKGNVVCRHGKWYLSITCTLTDEELQAYKDKRTGSGTVGVDLGISTLATCSDGKTFENHKHLKRMSQKKKRLQRWADRRKDGSANKRKMRARVSALEDQIARQRNYTQHQMTTALVRDNTVIVLEDLSVKNMQKNHRLAESIADAGWGTIRTQIEQKAELYGSTVIIAPQNYPSTKTCSRCGRVQDMPLHLRTYKCGECGLVMNRDLNAAINLRNLAAGDIVRVACSE